MRFKRSKSAQSLIEVTIGIIMLIPVALCLIDLSVILLGVQINDANCRNAARAAACGNPNEATFRARTVMRNSKLFATPPLISSSQLTAPVQIIIKSRPAVETDIANDSKLCPGGPVTGTTTVETSVKIKPFLVHLLYGGKSPLTFTAKHTFPITYIEPATTEFSKS